VPRVFNEDLGGLTPANRERIVPEAKLEGIAEGCHADDPDHGPGQEPHFHEATRHPPIAVDRHDFGDFAGTEIRKGGAHRLLIMNFFFVGNPLEFWERSL
jgi:hypothetical protein